MLSLPTRSCAGRARQTVRATLVFSPAWQQVAGADIKAMIRSWARWLAGKGVGDDWLALQGVYTEIDDSEETRLRAAAAPQTGWAGFHYDAALPDKHVAELLEEAARCGLQVVGIFPYMLDLFAKVARKVPIGELRWVQGHLATLTGEQIAEMADLGVGVTTHTSAHIYKRGHEHLKRLGERRQDEIVPLRSLLDAGVPVSFGTDNVPISMFHSIWHAVAPGDPHRCGSGNGSGADARRRAPLRQPWRRLDVLRRRGARRYRRGPAGRCSCALKRPAYLRHGRDKRDCRRDYDSRRRTVFERDVHPASLQDDNQHGRENDVWFNL